MSSPNSAKIPLPNTTTLILGGARSGKSGYAEKLAINSGKERIYIATAKVLDDEMKQRVSRHKKDRASSAWTTVEEPLALAKSLKKWAKPDSIILVDCLTMWITNLLSEEEIKEETNEEAHPPTFTSSKSGGVCLARLHKEVEELLVCINTLPCDVIFVSNEVSMGIIPMGELTRQYVDEAGRLHQQLAQQVENVILMVAGLPHKIKTNGELN